MAIKRPVKAKVEEQSLPADFLDHTKKAFSLQIISSVYEDAFKSEKDWIKQYLESTEEMTVERSTGVRTPEGVVTLSKRDNWKIDMTKIEEMIKTGQVSLATILAISSINATKLETAIGEKAFAGLAVNKPTEYLSMTATPDFKKSVTEAFELPAVAKPKANIAEPKEMSVAESIAKAKAASKKASKPALAEDELNEILKGV